MYRNKSVLEAIHRVLHERKMTMDEWEASIGWPKGSVVRSLQPPEEIGIHRNIKLPAEMLGIQSAVFLQQVSRIDEELG
jgi:hypothetical protein